MCAISVFDRKIKLFSFDLWETVIKEDEEFERTIRRGDFLAKKLEIQSSIVHQALKDLAVISRKVYRTEMRTLLTIERVNYLLDLLEKSLSEEEKKEIEKYFSEVSLHLQPPLIEGVSSFLKLLKSHGVKITMISDTGYTKGKDMRKLLTNHGIVHFFDAFIFSDEERTAKPSAHMFKRIESQFPEIDPESMVHMGDNPATDILGAVKRGWNAILFRRDIQEVSQLNIPEDVPFVNSYEELANCVKPIFY